MNNAESPTQSLMAQGAEFPLRKPPGFHYDFFLLGITTFIAGLLGIPAPNGLIPQAPIHTSSLLVMGRPPKHDVEDAVLLPPPRVSTAQHTLPESDVQYGAHIHSRHSNIPPKLESGVEHDPAKYPIIGVGAESPEVPVAVVEQRVSNLTQGALCLVLLTGPFLHVLNLIPRGVLAGLL